MAGIDDWDTLSDTFLYWIAKTCDDQYDTLIYCNEKVIIQIIENLGFEEQEFTFGKFVGLKVIGITNNKTDIKNLPNTLIKLLLENKNL
ncbi:MAG: hypothetical protein JKY32_04400, partial [Rhizobiales bacterium]|nr:hypothetical protein [Hyphomicrobiales bacterium]